MVLKWKLVALNLPALVLFWVAGACEGARLLLPACVHACVIEESAVPRPPVSHE